jgi:hypothetical protein
VELLPDARLSSQSATLKELALYGPRLVLLCSEAFATPLQHEIAARIAAYMTSRMNKLAGRLVHVTLSVCFGIHVLAIHLRLLEMYGTSYYTSAGSRLHQSLIFSHSPSQIRPLHIESAAIYQRLVKLLARNQPYTCWSVACNHAALARWYLFMIT